MVNYGFYEISDSVLLLLICVFLCFMLGSIIVDVRDKKLNSNLFTKQILLKKTKAVDFSEKKFDRYRMKSMLKYVIFVEITAILRLGFNLLKGGLSYISSDAFQGVLFSGVLGHLLITAYPLIPICFYYWLKHKKQKLYLIVSVCYECLIFCTFVQYHSIGMIVLIFLFVCLEDPKYVKKGIVLVIGIAIGLFILSYFVLFSIRGDTSSLRENYYIERLWNYIGGATIYCNNIFTKGILKDVSIGYKLCSFFVAPINFFLNKIFGFSIFPAVELDYLAVATNGELGNVISTIGYLYPYGADAVDIIIYFCVFVIFGVVLTALYNRSATKTYRLHVPVCVMLTFWVFFSFFGQFFVLFVPWEILMWSFVMPWLFMRQNKVTQ